MAYHTEKSSGDLVIDGFANGIAASPHKGIANMQAVNIATETGEVMCSFSRTRQSQANTGSTVGTITPSDSTHLTLSMPPFVMNGGIWITVSGSTITGLSSGNYYVLSSSGGGGSVQLASSYNGAAITGLGLTGSASFILIRNMTQPIASATEPYSNGTQQYRYYILDDQGLIWVYDSAVSTTGVTWFLPNTELATGATGIAILNGWLHVFVSTLIFCKQTVLLGNGLLKFAQGNMLTRNTHYAFVGHQGRIYYTDGNFLGSIFPNTSLLTGAANIQSYASYTAVTTTGTISQLIDGTTPYNGIDNTTRIPVVFFSGGGIATDLRGGGSATLSVIFYIKYLQGNSGFTDNSTFEVYAAASGGSAIDIATGSSGTQYFNTYCPLNASGEATLTFTPQKLNLPFFETATSIAEIGNTVIVGTKGNVIYPWNQTDPTPGDLIPLPENNVTSFLTVNNMAYVFAGYKGNIYVTNGSTASLVLSLPDYCAGIAGNEASYIEPYFTWGGVMFLRGRVYFSLQDETAAKTGNCGGVWSFIPTQNFFIGQDTGLALRLENQNSYATYNGMATVLLASQTQNAIGPQYWAGWLSSVTSPSYGIDFSNTTPTTASIETDLIPTGTLLDKDTFEQIEYKLAAPLVNGESVSVSYRQDGTSAYQSFGTAQTESTTGLSGYFTPVTDFEAGQWVQFKITLTPIVSAASSFVRLKEIRLR